MTTTNINCKHAKVFCSISSGGNDNYEELNNIADSIKGTRNLRMRSSLYNAEKEVEPSIFGIGLHEVKASNGDLNGTYDLLETSASMSDIDETRGLRTT
jgi:hypothetical protein